MPDEFRSAAFAGIGICAVMILFNLSKFKRRGWSVLFLSSAFAAFGLLLFALTQSAPNWAVYICAAVLAIGLLCDAVSRSSPAPDSPKGAPKK